jgi:hypothetical protein
MRLLIESAIIFFGTLMAAAVVALGGPAIVDLMTADAPQPHVQPAMQMLVSTQLHAMEHASPPRPAG